LVLTVVPSTVSAANGIDGTLCKSTTSRLTVPSGFPVAVCFDGTSVTIKNTTSLMIEVGSQGTSGPLVRKMDGADAAGVAAAALDTLPYRLPPNYQVTAPVNDQAAAFSVVVAPDENTYFWLNLVESYVPGGTSPGQGFADYEAMSAFVDSMTSIRSSYAQCESQASNFIYNAVCKADTASGVEVAVETLGDKLLLANLSKAGVLGGADKKFLGLIGVAITIAESDASLFLGNLQESSFLSASRIFHISASNPSQQIPTAYPDADGGGPVIPEYLAMANRVIALAEAGNIQAIADLDDPSNLHDPAIAQEVQLLSQPGALSELIKVLTKTHASGGDSIVWPYFLYKMNENDDAQDLAAMGVANVDDYTGLEVVVFTITDTPLMVSITRVVPTSTTTTSSPPPAESPSDGFYNAEEAWSTDVCTPAASEGTAWQQAASDLTYGETEDGGDTSGYAAAAAELNDLAALPDTDATPAQQAEYQSDVQALDAFFNTPGLYLSSPTSC
jgi:hypothetical protein